MPYETYLPQDVTKHAQSSLGANEIHPHTARGATLDGRPTDRVPSYNMKPVFVSLASCTGDKGCLAKGSSKAQAAVVTPLLSS